jgi:hypothetical protein
MDPYPFLHKLLDCKNDKEIKDILAAFSDYLEEHGDLRAEYVRKCSVMGYDDADVPFWYNVAGTTRGCISYLTPKKAWIGVVAEIVEFFKELSDEIPKQAD